MRADLEQQLKNDFTFLQAGSGPYEQYGIEVQDGWYDLLYAMCSEIQAAGGDFRVSQIKSKYGRLRVYYQTDNRLIDNIVVKYGTLSATVCALCGKPGTYRREHIIVLCDNCSTQCAGQS